MSLEEYLSALGIDAELISVGRETTTAGMAAEALGVPIDIVIKTILFQAKNGALVLVVAQGTGRIDTEKLAQVTGIDGWRLAKPDVVLDATGYPAGGTPPVGLKQRIHMIVDAKAAVLAEAYAGGGSHNVMLRIKPSDIIRINEAEIHDILA
ncbi:MAG: YbaK/EbsC family protein [candidate division NC10 bacterium]|nr:YbaK/EbsC family protein [candidate division NC10 bacterium]